MSRAARAGARSRKSMKAVPAVREADEHEAAAAQVAGGRMCYRQRQADRDGGIYGIAALFQDGETDIGRVGLDGNHHGVGGAHRFVCPHCRRAAHQERQCQERQAKGPRFHGWN